MMNIEKLCGAVPSPLDARDYSVRAMGALPSEAFLPRLPRIKKQTAGSCVAHSVAYCMEILSGEVFGVGFVYGYRPAGYSQSAGMIPRQAAQTVTTRGNVLLTDFCVEREMPEIKRIVDNKLSELTALADARKAASYARCYTAEDIKTAIVNGWPVAFVACISQPGCARGGIFPAISPTYGYHEMTVVGYRNDMFRVANSWGESWGEHGFCWMTASDVLRAGDALLFCGKPENDLVLRRTLKLGMRGNDVLKLEERLNLEPGITLIADGVFSGATRRAVGIVQKRLGLPATGTVGTRTWEALGL